MSGLGFGGGMKALGGLTGGIKSMAKDTQQATKSGGFAGGLLSFAKQVR
jgi:hypothetical protein